MGRRKKEPAGVHRDNIAAAAQRLFTEKGTEAATVDDIAEEAGYSKATIYVYFKNKEEIISFLAFKSMKLLYGYICEALDKFTGSRDRYYAVCRALLKYYDRCPYYFEAAIGRINLNFRGYDNEAERAEADNENETFDIGERINEKMEWFLAAGIKSGEIKADIAVVPTILSFWGMLSGLIQISDVKQEYIEARTGMGRSEFLEYGFAALYRSVSLEEE